MESSFILCSYLYLVAVVYVAIPTYIPMTIYLNRIHPLIMLSSDLLGGSFIISLSDGLNPSAIAGGPSVTRLTYSNYTDVNSSGIPSTTVRNIDTTSPMFDDIK